MGWQSRLRAQRREATERVRTQRGVIAKSGTGKGGVATETLREILYDIRRLTLEPPRRCWEYLVEIMANGSGWATDCNEAAHVWEVVPMLIERIHRFVLEWNEEVAAAKALGLPFSEPLGDLLAEVSADPDDAQPSMTEVRALNSEWLARIQERGRFKGLDPVCGTGRFAIDALVHDERVVMHVCEEDPWQYRAALVNSRFLARWTSWRSDDAVGQKFTVFDPPPERDEDGPGPLVLISGRIRAMNAHGGIVDLEYEPNWQMGILWWLPVPPWHANLLIDEKKFGFRGTWDQYVAARGETEARRRLQQPTERRIRYDFAMP